jgi:hypothetical protein
MIHFHCPNCAQEFTIADEHGGKKSRCPKCKQVVTIPDEPNPLLDALTSLDIKAPVPLRTYVPPEPTKFCPYCAEKVLEAAVICKHCNASLINAYNAEAQVSAAVPESPGRSDKHAKAETSGKSIKLIFILAVIAFL